MSCNVVDVQYAAVATSTTPKTVVGVLASTHIALRWLESCVSVNSGTSTDVPSKVELCANTFGTNPPGTNSTSITVANGKRDSARDAPQFTAAYGWTTEPTTITVLRTLYDPQYNGVYHYINPINSPYIVVGAGGASIRVTAGTGTPSVSGHMTVEE
jgi:hypothetical protein